jgi:glycerol-1-phosphate dehydrogenase [NAD(P)+]
MSVKSQEVSIKEALESATDTKTLEIGSNIIYQAPAIFKSQFPNAKKVVIVADKNTFNAAGKRVVDSFQNEGIAQENPFIFTDADLYADYKFVETLMDFLKGKDIVPLAVGSGVINDITKLAASRTDRQYMCIATAASMDGYTAFGSSMTVKGAKQTLACPAPKACLADIEVLRNAPPEMTAAGYGDLFAKITAGADWIIADAAGEEKIDMQAWNIVQGSLKKALSDPQALKNGNEEAFLNLIKGLMMGGFAMQYYKTSRPASGAEHQFSHLWSMEHFTNKGKDISHGFQVAVGTAAITAVYEKLIAYPFENLDIDAAVKAWKSKDEFIKQAESLFGGEDFKDLAVCEISAKYIEPSNLKEQLSNLKNNWGKIRKDLSEQIVPLSIVQKNFKEIGAPYLPEHIGMTASYLKKSFLRNLFIRRRFTVLDLILRAGLFDKIIS